MITEKQKRSIGIVLLLFCIVTMIGWMFGFVIPIPGAIFWILLGIGIVLSFPSKKKKEKQNTN